MNETADSSFSVTVYRFVSNGSRPQIVSCYYPSRQVSSARLVYRSKPTPYRQGASNSLHKPGGYYVPAIIAITIALCYTSLYLNRRGVSCLESTYHPRLRSIRGVAPRMLKPTSCTVPHQVARNLSEPLSRGKGCRRIQGVNPHCRAQSSRTPWFLLVDICAKM